MEDQASASFVVFRTPLSVMREMETLDRILLTALKIEKTHSLYTLVEQGRRYEGNDFNGRSIEFTERSQSPFNQLYNGQLLGFKETEKSKADRIRIG